MEAWIGNLILKINSLSQNREITLIILINVINNKPGDTNPTES